jgi:RNA polymerase sigma factor (sigma-70 family)
MSQLQDDDLSIVDQALAGSRSAFERIVQRYQTLVCSITYSGTGDLGVSEDLAQETFLTAWQHLRQLRDPRALGAWLCGIARRTVANRRRREARRPPTESLNVESASYHVEPAVEEVVTREEQALVWQALGDLPEKYREPLILFYRSECSIRQVASDLALSENAVKQRLSRGRQKLSEKVAAMVEATLTKSSPGKKFAIGVVAALPATAPNMAKAAALTTVSRNAAASKTLFGSALATPVIASLIGVFNAWFAVSASAREAHPGEERRFAYRVGALLFGYFLLLDLLIAAGYILLSTLSLPTVIGILALISISYIVGIVWFAIWSNRRQREIRTKTADCAARNAKLSESCGPIKVGKLATHVFLAVFWILAMAILFADWAAAAVILGTGAGGLFVLYLSIRSDQRTGDRVGTAINIGLAVLNLAIINIRWPLWMMLLAPSLAQNNRRLPLQWAANLLVIGIFSFTLVSMFFRQPRV